MVQGATNIYTSTHHMDLRFINVDEKYDKFQIKKSSMF